MMQHCCFITRHGRPMNGFFFVPAFGGRVAKAAVVDLVVDIV